MILITLLLSLFCIVLLSVTISLTHSLGTAHIYAESLKQEMIQYLMKIENLQEIDRINKLEIFNLKIKLKEANDN